MIKVLRTEQRRTEEDRAKEDWDVLAIRDIRQGGVPSQPAGPRSCQCSQGSLQLMRVKN